MTDLVQIGTAAHTAPIRSWRVEAARAASDPRFDTAHSRASAQKPQQTAQPVVHLSQSGTARDASWERPLLQAGFVAQVLGQSGGSTDVLTQRRAAAKAYGPQAIRPAVLIDTKL